MAVLRACRSGASAQCAAMAEAEAVLALAQAEDAGEVEEVPEDCVAGMLSATSSRSQAEIARSLRKMWTVTPESQIRSVYSAFPGFSRSLEQCDNAVECLS